MQRNIDLGFDVSSFRNWITTMAYSMFEELSPQVRGHLKTTPNIDGIQDSIQVIVQKLNSDKFDGICGNS